MPAANARKSFDVTPAATDSAPVPFDLTWTGPDGEKHVEEFKAQPERIPAASLMRIPNMRVDGDSVAMFKTFEAALGDDYERFLRIIEDPNCAVSAESLGLIIAWLAEEATGRPTPQS